MIFCHTSLALLKVTEHENGLSAASVKCLVVFLQETWVEYMKFWRERCCLPAQGDVQVKISDLFGKYDLKDHYCLTRDDEKKCLYYAKSLYGDVSNGMDNKIV